MCESVLVKELREKLSDIHDSFMTLAKEGKSLVEILNSGISASYDEEMGRGFLNVQSFVTLM